MKPEDLNNIVFVYKSSNGDEIYKVTNVTDYDCHLQDVESDWFDDCYPINDIIKQIRRGIYIILYKDSWFLNSSYGRLLKLFK